VFRLQGDVFPGLVTNNQTEQKCKKNPKQSSFNALFGIAYSKKERY